MKAPPNGWPRISSAVFYGDAPKAIDWLCSAFGFEVRLKVEGGEGIILHSELLFGDGLIMVGSSKKAEGRDYCVSPQSVNGVNTQSILVQVEDVEAHCERARAAGAEIKSEPEVHDYGEDYWADKVYEAVDPEGHHWWFSERVRDPATVNK